YTDLAVLLNVAAWSGPGWALNREWVAVLVCALDRETGVFAWTEFDTIRLDYQSVQLWGFKEFLGVFGFEQHYVVTYFNFAFSQRMAKVFEEGACPVFPRIAGQLGADRVRDCLLDGVGVH